jgi:hypothetical protein
MVVAIPATAIAARMATTPSKTAIVAKVSFFSTFSVEAVPGEFQEWIKSVNEW